MKPNSPEPTEPISERFPALEEQEVVLTFYAPDAHMVGVAGSFNEWNPLANPLEHTADGEWSIRLMLAKRWRSNWAILPLGAIPPA